MIDVLWWMLTVGAHQAGFGDVPVPQQPAVDSAPVLPMDVRYMSWNDYDAASIVKQLDGVCGQLLGEMAGLPLPIDTTGDEEWAALLEREVAHSSGQQLQQLHVDYTPEGRYGGLSQLLDVGYFFI